jgi:surface antigen
MRRLAGTLVWIVTAVWTASAQETGTLEGPEGQAMEDTVQHALEHNPTKEASEWVNPDTGRSGSVAPVRTFDNAQGQPCREFVTKIIIGGKEEQGYGTACRQPDGSWEIVPEDRQTPAPPPAPPREVYVYPPPMRYYAYPPGFYGPVPIFLSFSYVYRSGRLHRGSYYLDGRRFRQRYPFVIRERVFVGPRVYDRFHWRGGGDQRDRSDRGDRRGRGGARWGDPDRSRGRDDRGRD